MNKLFFPQRLTDKCKHILTAPLTIVEAPAGYGKTTVVHSILDKEDDAYVYWYTAVENTTDVSFSFFVHKLMSLDPNIIHKLSQYETLNRTNADTIAKLIMNVNVKKNMLYRH